MKIDFSKLAKKAPEFDLEALFDANLHYGHKVSQWHPKMQEWIHSQKNGVHIFDLEKSAKQLAVAYDYFYELGAQDKQVIVVGTKKQAKDLVVSLTAGSGVHYIVARWLGGFLTNWDQVFKSLKKMNTTKEKLDSNGFSNRTKYEVMRIEKELSRSRRFFDGVKDLKAKPDVLLVIDPKKEKNAVKEAKLEGVCVVALADSDTNPTPIDLLIPGNDDAVKSIEYVLTKLVEAYVLGKKSIAKSVKKPSDEGKTK